MEKQQNNGELSPIHSQLSIKTPLVRFPEFKEDWEQKQFEEFLIHTPRPKPKSKNNYLSIGIRSHFKGTFQKPNTDPNKNGMDTLYEIKENDFLVNITFAWEGALAIVQKEDDGGFVSHRFPTYTFQKGFNNLFFKYHFFKEKSKHQLGIVSPGGAGRNRVMSKRDFIKLKLPFPTLPEQKKIAHFFTTLDKKRSQLEEKKNALEQYKKGMMQQLFSQELRFKDENGNTFTDWEEKKLKDICDVNMGQSPGSSSYNSNGFGKYLVQGNADISDRKTTPRNWTSAPTKLCEIGDVIMTVRAPVGAIAKSDHNACIGRGVCSIKNKSNSDIEFLYQILLNFENKWTSLEQGSTFTAVSGKDIRNLKLAIPIFLTEQTQIANFLSKIDAKINAVNTQIEQTNTYKKGMLQSMFV